LYDLKKGIATFLEGKYHVSASSLTAAAVKELANYKLDLVGVQDVRWYQRGTVRAGKYNFLYGKGNENQLQTGSSVTSE
jgi:hypothetical protein